VYPLPPHGHHPNFTGAKDACASLLAHPQVQAHACLIVGAERVLYPFRRDALAAGKVLYLPDLKREGWYVRVSDVAGADLKRSRAVGEPKLRPEDATAAVLACVAAGQDGGRLSKGFGWGRDGLPTQALPTFTVAHPRMLYGALPCPPDSRVALIGLPGEVIECASGEPDSPVL